jgi:hypothetical protein
MISLALGSWVACTATSATGAPGGGEAGEDRESTGEDTADSGAGDGDTADPGGGHGPWTAPGTDAGRIAAYHWDPDASAAPVDLDVRPWGARDLAGMGARAIRVTLSARDDYDGANLGETRLVDIAASEHWAALFASGNFDTVLLTTYTAADIAGQWADGLSAEEAAAETAEIAELGAWLLEHAPGVIFVLLNWEGDNALAPVKSSAVAWEGYAAWIEARVAGVEAARAAVPGSSARLYTGLEFNAVDDLVTGAPCGSVPRDCVLSVIGPSARVDVFSYSSWQSASVYVGDGDLGARYAADLDRIEAALSSGHADLRREQILVGEYGAIREYHGECSAAQRSANMTEALLAWGAGMGVHWQLRDNPGAQTWYGYGLLSRDDRETLSGPYFRETWSGSAHAAIPSACPRINEGGVVDGQTFDADIAAGATLSIFGGGFSAEGNVVHFDQDGTLFEVTAGSPWWYESAGQINATLPSGVVAGDGIRVWVTGPEGWESNAVRIAVREG